MMINCTWISGSSATQKHDHLPDKKLHQTRDDKKEPTITKLYTLYKYWQLRGKPVAGKLADSNPERNRILITSVLWNATLHNYSNLITRNQVK